MNVANWANTIKGLKNEGEGILIKNTFAHQ